MEPNFYFLPESVTNLIKQRETLEDDTLLSLHRELEAVSRLLLIEIYYEKRREHLRRLACAQSVNYLKTPISIHGLLPPVELTLKLACYDVSEPISQELLEDLDDLEL